MNWFNCGLLGLWFSCPKKDDDPSLDLIEDAENENVSLAFSNPLFDGIPKSQAVRTSKSLDELLSLPIEIWELILSELTCRDRQNFTAFLLLWTDYEIRPPDRQRILFSLSQLSWKHHWPEIEDQIEQHPIHGLLHARLFFTSSLRLPDVPIYAQFSAEALSFLSSSSSRVTFRVKKPGRVGGEGGLEIPQLREFFCEPHSLSEGKPIPLSEMMPDVFPPDLAFHVIQKGECGFDVDPSFWGIKVSSPDLENSPFSSLQWPTFYPVSPQALLSLRLIIKVDLFCSTSVLKHTNHRNFPPFDPDLREMMIRPCGRINSTPQLIFNVFWVSN